MNEQHEPAMDQHPVTTQERIDGILAQTRADVGDKSLERIREVLAQRLQQAGVEVDDGSLDEFASRVSLGKH